MQKRLLISLVSIFFAFSIIIFVPIVSSTQEKFTIQKEGDVEVISNPKHPIPKDGSRKKLVFEEDLSIGVTEGNENYMFGELICFNTDEEGNFETDIPVEGFFFNNGKAYAVATEGGYKFVKRYRIEIQEY